MPLQKHVWEVMESEFTTIQTDATVGEAARLLAEKVRTSRHVQGLIVVDSENRYKGIVTVKDILGHLKGLFDNSCDAGGPNILNLFSDRCRMDAGKKVSEIMKKENVMIAPNSTLVDAMKKLMDDSVRVMPVVEGNRPVGVLYLHDLFLFMKELIED